MLLLADLDHWKQKFEFGILLPLLSRLPLWMGDPLSRIRGIFHALLGFDWRAKALGMNYVKKQTYKAMGIMSPENSTLKKKILTWQRFIYNSKEEWQAGLFAHIAVMKHIAGKSKIESLDILLKNQRKGQGQVLISCHFDSFCLGMVLMGMQGLHINVVNTSDIEDQRIHPTVRSFFQTKYINMEKLINGRMPYYQKEMSYFYHVLDKGEIVTLMGDIPGGKSDIIIPFLGTKFKLPLGAWHMAKETGSLIGGYMVVQKGLGSYHVVSYPPVEIDQTDPYKTLIPIYNFMERWIKKMPQRWISADLLPGYDNVRQ